MNKETSSLITGAALAAFFNPIDKALYLAVKDKRPFIHRYNFKRPYQGFAQTIGHRTLSAGLYYYLQENVETLLKPLQTHFAISPTQFNIIHGISVGALNGAILNPIASIKYHAWGNGHISFIKAIRHKWHSGGARPFFKGTLATMKRDMIFGASYETLRHSFRDESQANKNVLYNFFAALVATTASAPLNYLRNRRYATPPEQKPVSALIQFNRLWKNAKQAPTLSRRLHYILIQRFLIGWGTIRVATGMAMGQALFDKLSASDQVAQSNKIGPSQQ